MPKAQGVFTKVKKESRALSLPVFQNDFEKFSGVFVELPRLRCHIVDVYCGHCRSWDGNRRARDHTCHSPRSPTPIIDYAQEAWERVVAVIEDEDWPEDDALPSIYQIFSETV